MCRTNRYDTPLTLGQVEGWFGEYCIGSFGFSLCIVALAAKLPTISASLCKTRLRTRRNDADASAEEIDVVLTILHRFEDRGQVPNHFAWRDIALLDLSDNHHVTAPDTPLDGLTSVFLQAAIRLEAVAVITAEEREIAQNLRYQGKPVFRPFKPGRFTEWDETTLALNFQEAEGLAPTGSQVGQHECFDQATGVSQVRCRLWYGRCAKLAS